jgi:hypothetical protein
MHVIDPTSADAKPHKRTPLEIRRDAAQATLDKFRDQPFAPGSADCAQMVRYHCRQVGRPLKFAAKLTYKSLLQGRRVLKGLGFATMAEALDSQFSPITPAAALVGDIVELRSSDDEATNGGLGALVIALGNQAFLGWHEDAVGGCVMRLGDKEIPLRAWRVLE